MSWWTSAGASALYGVVAGSVLTGMSTYFNNLHGDKVAERERRHAMEDADREWSRQLQLEEWRSIRGYRERFYPQAASQSRDLAMALELSIDAVATGQPYSPDISRIDQAELRQMWGDLHTFASQDVRSAWVEFADTARIVDEKLFATSQLRGAERAKALADAHQALDRLGECQKALLAALRAAFVTD